MIRLSEFPLASWHLLLCFPRCLIAPCPSAYKPVVTLDESSLCPIPAMLNWFSEHIGQGVHPSLLWFAYFPLPRLLPTLSSGLCLMNPTGHILWDTFYDTALCYVLMSPTE